MAAEMERILHSTNKEIELFHKQLDQNSKISQHQLTDLQVKIENARNSLQELMQKSPELHQANPQLMKQVVAGLDRITQERLIKLGIGTQGQMPLFLGAIKDFKKLLRRGERVEKIGETEEQGT